MEVDDIFGYDKLVAAEKANLQAGMNYREGRHYSIDQPERFTHRERKILS